MSILTNRYFNDNAFVIFKTKKKKLLLNNKRKIQKSLNKMIERMSYFRERLRMRVYYDKFISNIIRWFEKTSIIFFAKLLLYTNVESKWQTNWIRLQLATKSHMRFWRTWRNYVFLCIWCTICVNVTIEMCWCFVIDFLINDWWKSYCKIRIFEYWWFVFNINFRNASSFWKSLIAIKMI